MAFSEDSKFTLEVLNRVLAAESQSGVKSLSVLEITIFYANHFDYEEQNGGLSQFFYNCDCSPAFVEHTASALVTIGAPRTAEVVRGAASLFFHRPEGNLGSTWGDYKKAVDPEDRLKQYDSQLPVEDEDIDSLLECFILKNRHALQKRPP